MKKKKKKKKMSLDFFRQGNQLQDTPASSSEDETEEFDHTPPELKMQEQTSSSSLHLYQSDQASSNFGSDVEMNAYSKKEQIEDYFGSSLSFNSSSCPNLTAVQKQQQEFQEQKLKQSANSKGKRSSCQLQTSSPSKDFEIANLKRAQVLQEQQQQTKNKTPMSPKSLQNRLVDQFSRLFKKVTNLKFENHKDSDKTLFDQLIAKENEMLEIVEKLENNKQNVELQEYMNPNSILPNTPKTGKGLELHKRANSDLKFEMKFLKLKFSPDSAILRDEKELKKKVLEYVDEVVGEKIWNLIYRATRDGWSSNSFFNKINNVNQPLICLIKTRKGSIFGGFSCRKWTVNGVWTQDPNCFVFSLLNTACAERPPLKFGNKRPEFAFKCGNNGSSMQANGVNSQPGWIFSFALNDFGLNFSFSFSFCQNF